MRHFVIFSLFVVLYIAACGPANNQASAVDMNLEQNGKISYTYHITDSQQATSLLHTVLTLPAIPQSDQYFTCSASPITYSFIFKQGQQGTFKVTYKCSRLFLSDNTMKRATSTFWQQVDQIVGTSIQPYGP